MTLAELPMGLPHDLLKAHHKLVLQNDHPNVIFPPNALVAQRI